MPTVTARTPDSEGADAPLGALDVDMTVRLYRNEEEER